MMSLMYHSWLMPLLPLIVMMFVSSITPGPNNILIMTASAQVGFRRCIPHWLGIGLGFAFQVLMVITGLAVVFHSWPPLQRVLGVFAALYLLWMAWGLTKQAWIVGKENEVKLPADQPKQPSRARRFQHDPRTPMTFMGACAFQWINPKAWTMAIAIPAGLIPSQWPVSVGIFATLMVVVAVNLPCVAAWAALGASLRHHLQRVIVARLSMAL